MFGLKPSVIEEFSCMADGADYCEWKFTWELQDVHRFLWPTIGFLVGTATFISLRALHPSSSVIESLILAAFPAVTVWLVYSRRKLQHNVKEREALIDEQLQSVETQHEELRQAYVEQGERAVELRRKVGQLTVLHQTGTLLNSTHEREILLESALRALIKELYYDRAMVTFYDRTRKVSYDARILGVSEEIEKFARSIEVPIRDANSIEGMVLLRETPILVRDIREVWDRMHPLTQQLTSATKTKSFVSVPLKVNHRVIGSLTVDRVQENSLTQDDLDMMMTLASQFSIALDNAEAYHQIEELNIGLEAKVRERTLELEQANQKVQLQSTELAEWNKTLECRVKEQIAQVEKLGKLKRFFSPQLAELIVAGDTADPLKSHRRNITVVFLDLRGYTSFAETVAPEELMGMLQEFHAAMGKTVMEYNGTLERFTGDGMMVFFNDPTPIPNPGEQAARMANTMQGQVEELKIKWAKNGYLLDLGIGMAHGHATIGTIGFEGRWDYSAIGPVTNLAARLCSEAQAGQILVSRQFLVTVEHLVEADLVGELTLKGFRQPITAYNITRLKA
jgi:class 3 adenylate cyclase/GAF domain-containing protein